MQKGKELLYQELLVYRGRHSIEKIASFECSRRTKALLEEVAFMLTLCFRDALDRHFTRRTAKNVYKILCTGPLDVILTDFKEIDNLLLHQFGDPEASVALDGAIQECCDGSRQILGLLRYYLDFVARDGDIVAMGNLHQVFQFAARITLRDNELAKIKTFTKYQLAIAGILAHDDVLATEYMQTWVASVFRKSTDPLKRFSPHHSAGAVVEKGKTKEGKSRPLYPEERWALTNGPITHYLLTQAGIQSYPGPWNKVFRDTKDIFVPKGVDSSRIVAPERVQLLFCQHGLAESLNSTLQEELGRHYCRHDASVNRRMAHDASVSRLYDTLDLSSASDSVRFSLVMSLFAKLPKWKRALRLVRSTTSYWPDGKLHPKVMYGSMGNPLTFPLEVLCFCALIEEAGNRLGRYNFSYWVYGDDLIVPHWLTKTLIDVLTEFGFTVNVNKSFIGDCPFRESCGGDFIDGVDVTPVRISRTWPGSFVGSGKRNLSTSQVISLVDMANRSFNRLPLVRWYCIHTLEKHNVPIVYSEDRSGACVLHAERPQNSHLLFREGEFDLQYRKVRCATVSMKQRKLPNTDYVQQCLYWHWLESHQTDSMHSSLWDALRAGTPVPIPNSLHSVEEDGEIKWVFETTDLIPKLADKGELRLVYRWVDDKYT